MSWQPWNGSLADLAALAESPLSDGMLRDWLEHQAVSFADVTALVALFGKDDPHLQEAGVELATALLRSAPPGALAETRAALEPALATIVKPDVDSYVVEALAELLDEHPLTSVIAALARHHVDERAARPLPTSPPVPPVYGGSKDRHFIVRNRMPQGWMRLEQLYVRLALAAGDTPTARDLAYLPVLEARHGTRGWEATRAAVTRDPDGRDDMRR